MRHVRAMLAGLVAGVAALVSAGEADAQRITPVAAPAEWVRYAEAATTTLATWLNEEGEAPTRFRGYLDQTRPDAGEHAPVDLKLWIAANGAIERIDFASYADERANADLRAAIVGRALPRPPAGMVLPLRVRIATDALPG